MEQNEYLASIELILKDNELMKLILHDQIYVLLIHTPLFSIFIHFTLYNQAKNVSYDIVRRLRKQNFLLEASKLFADTENLYGEYQTISRCLALAENFNKS